MSLDFNKEQAITLSEVPRYVPKRRGKVERRKERDRLGVVARSCGGLARYLQSGADQSS